MRRVTRYIVNRRGRVHTPTVLTKIDATPLRIRPLISTNWFSSTAAPATGSETIAKSKMKSDPNIFFDNLGTIFLSTIGLIIASLVRSSYGTSNKNKVRDRLEEQAAIDPLEIDDLRVANSEFNMIVFRGLAEDIVDAFPEGSATYEAVVDRVRSFLTSYVDTHVNIQMVGTLEFGHLIDRVVLGALEKRGNNSDQPMPILFWLTVLSLALNAQVPDRIQLLYSLLKPQSKAPTIQEVRKIVGYLQDTCQLVPEAQIVATDRKYPFQQYECGSPDTLVEWEGKDDEEVDIDAFAAILRSRSVCAWGECYQKKKIV